MSLTVCFAYMIETAEINSAVTQQSHNAILIIHGSFFFIRPLFSRTNVRYAHSNLLCAINICIRPVQCFHFCYFGTQILIHRVCLVIVPPVHNADYVAEIFSLFLSLRLCLAAAFFFCLCVVCLLSQYCIVFLFFSFNVLQSNILEPVYARMCRVVTRPF